MKLALIPPIPHLTWVDRFIYHMVIAPVAWENSGYAQYYRKAKGFKILDNGAFEGDMLSMKQIHQIARTIGANEIVLPDVLGDDVGTLALVTESLKSADEQFSYAAVVQGSDYEACMRLVAYYNVHPQISTIMIPKHLGSIDQGIRTKLAGFAHKPVHLLGAINNYTEEVMDIPYELRVKIRGIDTSLPFVLASYFKRLKAGIDFSDLPRQKAYFSKQLTGEQLDLASSNIDTYLSWILTL